MKNNYKCKFISLAIVSILYMNNLNAAVINMTDSDFPTSKVVANTDDITISTTSNGILTPHINTMINGLNTMANGLVGISATGNHHLTINSSDTFGIHSDIFDAAHTNPQNTFSGIHVANGGVFTGNGNIDININMGTGVYVASEGRAIFNGKLNIQSSGYNSIGIRAYSSSTIASNGQFNGEVTIVSQGDNSIGISSQITNSNGTPSSLFFDKKVNVIMNGNGSTGIIVQDPTPTTNQASIYFKEGLDLYVANGVGIFSQRDSHAIQIEGNSRLVAINDTVLKSSAGSIAVNDRADIQGNIEAYNAGVVSLNLSSNSSIIGILNNYSDPTIGQPQIAGSIYVNFTGSGSHWAITDSSVISSLAGQGHLTFNNYKIGTYLSIADSNGASGNHTVEVLDSGSNINNDANGVTLISTHGGNALFSMPTLANIGAYQYDIQKIGNNWQLAKARSFSLTTNNAVNSLRAGYLMNYNENQSLLQRMGELRNTNSGGDLWAKILAGKNKVDGNSQLSAFDQKFYGIQVGTDTRKIINENADFYLGLAFGYTHSDQDFSKGDGNIDSYYFNAYGSYTNTNGLYLDSVIKLGWQKQDFSLQDNQNNTVTGDTDSSIFGLSAELGYKYYLASEQKMGWFTQPSVQLAYSQVDSDTFTASNGQKINFDSYSSVLGKAGLMIGYDFSQSSSNPFNVYLKTNYFHEFSGDLDGKINNERIKTDLGSNWWNYGIGFNAQVKNVHNIYFDIDQSRGADFKQLWKLNIGYRYQW
ncbi:autotransporter outer membrane beta-barrel domain-containing protein [Orbus wheelerorum]|uniref:autotransporter outer membrane beta-barrel domain-containing protein n=1 Tax=Orbus wheelerorum TaxID=3074111 RepID=UPI00370D1213